MARLYKTVVAKCIFCLCIWKNSVSLQRDKNIETKDKNKMKKLVSLLLVLAFTLTAGTAYSRNVTEEMAKTAGAWFMRNNTDLGNVEASSLSLVCKVDNPILGIPACYLFNVGRSGWIMIGGTTATNAVVGYSECGTLEESLLPTPMVCLMNDYAEFVSAIQNIDNGKFSDLPEWDNLLNEKEIPSAKDDGDSFLMAETWDQGGDYGRDYNMYSPVVNYKYCPTGCVATALGQICHYYSYPVQPTGSKSYTFEDTINNVTHEFSVDYDTVSFDYSLMPNTLTVNTPIAKRREVSKLGYMLGISVEMHYKPQGSGANSQDVPDAMRRYFKYKKGVMTYRRASFTGQYAYMLNYSPYNGAVTDASFFKKLRQELRRNRPVYMGGHSSSGSGRDAGGHAWVCDGCQENNDSLYHMNWGWGGSSNGWFRLLANNMYIPSQGYNFKLMQEHITGMVPPQDSVDFNISTIEGIDGVEGVELLPAYPNPATYSVVLPYSVDNAAVMTIMSVDGKVVETRKVEAGNGRVEVKVNNLPAGIYVYRINGSAGKFIVQ